MRILYADREEMLEAGDAFYLEPGHVPVAEEEVEAIFFSPTEAYRKTKAVFEAAAKGEESPQHESRPEA